MKASKSDIMSLILSTAARCEGSQVVEAKRNWCIGYFIIIFVMQMYVAVREREASPVPAAVLVIMSMIHTLQWEVCP